MLSSLDYNKVVIANLLQLAHATLLAGHGAAYEIPSEMIENPSVLLNDIAKVAEHSILAEGQQ